PAGVRRHHLRHPHRRAGPVRRGGRLRADGDGLALAGLAAGRRRRRPPPRPGLGALAGPRGGDRPMIRADIAELLHAGYGDRTIARHLTVPTSSVTRARTLLGLPKAHNGTKPTTTVEDAFWKWIKAADGEHLDWAGPRHTNGTPMLHWSRGRRSALRIAYRIANGHEPDGLAFTACAHPGCVAPKHIGDTAHATRPGHHTASTGRPPNASRDQVVALLRQGLSDRQVGNRLRTSPRRVAAIRVEEGIPPA